MIPEARAAVVIASWRCGGTFLAHCLSNHPEIHCDRGEPMHKRSPWRMAMPGDPWPLLRCALSQVHYRVSMCKLTYTQAFHELVLPHLVKLQPAVIWLRRENVVRQAVSLILLKRLNNRLPAGVVVHTMVDLPVTRVALEPGVILRQARDLARADGEAKERLDRWFPGYLSLTYARIVGGESAVASRLPATIGRRICDHLGVDYAPLTTVLRRVNAYPLREMLTNWGEVEGAIRGSELADCLKDEERWI